MHRNPYSYPQEVSSEPLLAADFAHSCARVAYFDANRIDGARPPRVLSQVQLPELRRVEIVDATEDGEELSLSEETGGHVISFVVVAGWLLILAAAVAHAFF